jgi:hypothetical protein
MPIHLCNAKKLAQELRHGKVSPKDRGYYLVTSFVIFLVFYYSGFASANPPWSWLSIYEFIVLIFVTIVGLSKVYGAAKGDTYPDFVTEFTCLYVPVSVTTFLVIWCLFWTVTFGFREAIIQISESNLQIAINLSRIGGDLFGLLAFLAVVSVQAVTFYRITKLFETVHSDESDS